MASGNTLLVIDSGSAVEHASTSQHFEAFDVNVVGIKIPGSGTPSVGFAPVVMPAHYSGGGVTFVLHLVSISGAGDLDIGVSFTKLTDETLSSSGGAAYVYSVNNSLPAATTVFEVSINVSDGAQMDSVVAGDIFQFAVQRDGVSDTDTDYVILLGIEIKEQ